jgi:hypothetical protein
LQKKYNFIYFNKNKMELPLPLDQFRFNLVLWILITAYWMSGIGNYFAFIPGCSKEDAELLWYKQNWNYSFWLISSLIFFLLWISQFQYPFLIYLSIWEIYLIIIIYSYLIIKKVTYYKLIKERKLLIKKTFERSNKNNNSNNSAI